jgi:hypothetical protein
MSKRSNDISSKITINNINNIINNKPSKTRKYNEINSDDEMIEDNQTDDNNEFDMKKKRIAYKDLKTERLQYRKNKEINFFTQDHLEFAKNVVAEQKGLQIVTNESFQISSYWFEKDTIKYLDLIPDCKFVILENTDDIFHIDIKITKDSEIMHFQLKLDKQETEFVEYIPVEVTFKWEDEMKILYEEIELNSGTIKYFFSAIMEYKYK